ncbi:MAG: MBL fold metallo-hydrolase [Firmicutes bacterium]|nr:MBL fold metallo-hydrolase [Bacillota bacterium]MDD7602803.1 MBL fold metallo-hydrolase [Bacillota bacterium]MDY5855746.1 MBL fold metallo-hydrolase [Anaerovoracaceae bacterium]
MKITRFIGGSLESNGYVIRTSGGTGCYIIDPGYEPQKFIEFVEKEGLHPLGILLTHHHHDHVGAAARVADVLGCPVMMHEIDAAVYKGNVDRLLTGGDHLDLDGETLQILHTPGHTAGSICILSEKSRVVFSGDTIFDTDLGRTDLSDGSPADMIRSCRQVISRWTNDYTVYPGHDESATMKQIRIYNREFLACLDGIQTGGAQGGSPEVRR